MMIKRRDVLLAAASHGLAFWSVAAFGQTKGKEQKESGALRRSRRMIELIRYSLRFATSITCRD